METALRLPPSVTDSGVVLNQMLPFLLLAKMVLRLLLKHFQPINKLLKHLKLKKILVIVMLYYTTFNLSQKISSTIDDDDDDDDDDVYEGEEEEEEEKQPISIEKYLEQKRSDKKRKLDQLDAESKQAEKEKEERKAKYALQQVNLFNAYQTLLDVIRGYPRYLMLHHTRAMQVQYMAYTNISKVI